MAVGRDRSVHGDGQLWAATSGGVAECEWLRKRGADFTVLNDWGHGAMAKAAWRGNLELLDWLWENVVPARGQIWQKDADGRCPVDLAQAKGHVEAVAWLRAKEMT